MADPQELDFLLFDIEQESDTSQPDTLQSNQREASVQQEASATIDDADYKKVCNVFQKIMAIAILRFYSLYILYWL